MSRLSVQGAETVTFPKGKPVVLDRNRRVIGHSSTIRQGFFRKKDGNCRYGRGRSTFLPEPDHVSSMGVVFRIKRIKHHMVSLPVVLGVARPVSAPSEKKMPDMATAQPLTAEVRKEVFERDDHTCQCCGFQSKKYQEVHFIDHNPRNVTMGNMATTCIFCHQCFNMDLASAMRSAVLIWLPEVSQTDLHHVMRAVYVARISQGPMAEAARATLDSLMARREEARRRLGTDDPYALATVLKDFLTNRHYAGRQEKLEGIRLMPLDRRLIREADLEFNQFPQILAYWRSKDGPFGERSPTLWLNIYRNAIKEEANSQAEGF